MAETGAMADIGPGGQPGLTPWQRLKGIFGGSAGNLVEWYDWFAYTGFSIYFASAFFPEGDDTAQLLKAALVNIVSFGARPLGAWMMGLYADRRGRKAALTLSVSMMCLGSLIIALAPTYSQLGDYGYLAPFVLVGARLLQGLSVGGEYGASATYMSEMASRHRRGFWSSFQYVTLIMGQLVAAGVLIILQRVYDEPELKEWAWRIPFFIGAGLAVVVFWMRRGMHESKSYENAKAEGHERATTMMLFKRYPRETLMIMGLTAGGSLAFYAYTTYMLKFLVGTAGFAKDQASVINFAVLTVFMCAQPLWGHFSDKVGRKTMLITAFGGGVLIAVPIFTLISQSYAFGVPAAIALCCIPLLINSGYSSISAVVKAELFPAHVRALGVALPYAISNAIFGGTAEPIALWFKQIGMESGFYWYVAGVMCVGFIVALNIRDTRKHSLIKED